MKRRIDRERAGRERDSANAQRHIAELQAARKRALILGNEDLRMLVAQFGPVLWDVILVARAAVDASDPTRGAPVEDTASVSSASSERVEGSSTVHYRRVREAFRRRLGKLVADFAHQFGAELVDHRAYSSHTRWHLETDTPTTDCDYCLLDPRLGCRVAGCDRIRRPGEDHCAKHAA